MSNSQVIVMKYIVVIESVQIGFSRCCVIHKNQFMMSMYVARIASYGARSCNGLHSVLLVFVT